MRRWIVVTWLLVLFSPAAEASKIRVVLKPATAVELKVNLRAVNGRPRLVHLWATWCMPCVAEWPRLAAYLRQVAGRPLDIITVSLDDASHAPLAARMLSQNGGVPGETLIASPAEALTALKAIDPQWDGALPLTLFLDNQGRIILAQRGITQFDELVRAIDRIVPQQKRGLGSTRKLRP